MISAYILVCLAAFLWLLWLLRLKRVSIGLPVAYMYSLLLIHIPGAYAHVVGRDVFTTSGLVEVAMRFTAIGAVCFVIGVWSARRPKLAVSPTTFQVLDRQRFCYFCVLGGWLLIYGLSPLFRFPSIGAVIQEGGGIWMLGVLLGLRTAFQRRSYRWIFLWLSALMVYPVLMLLLGGFLSYGSAAIIIVCSVLTVSTTRVWQVAAGIVLFTFVSLSIFVNYFEHRDDIRHQVWGGASLHARVESVIRTADDFEWFDSTNRAHLIALDARLNQNFFVGLAAVRIQDGRAKYLYGQSLWEGLLALVPRAIWPQKPVFAGSPEIVSKMTGLWLSATSSFGVGNVMEFQINFGIPGVIIGFFLLGWAIGWLDIKAASAERAGNTGHLMILFLCAVALIKPNGSLVELSSGSAAAVIAAQMWSVVWRRFGSRKLTIAIHGTDLGCRESSLYQRQPAR